MWKKLWKEWIAPTLFAVVIALVMRSYVAEARVIPTPSMEPTILVRDRVLIDKVLYRFSELDRGDVIVFWPPSHMAVEYPYIKRIIGLPGETVEIRAGIVFINNNRLEEEYTRAWYGNYGPVTVPVGKYFVMGDNRGDSLDSRSWGFVNENDILGKAECIIWPPARLGILHKK